MRRTTIQRAKVRLHFFLCWDMVFHCVPHCCLLPVPPEASFSSVLYSSCWL
jgi:hypothetical protein